MGSVPGSRRSNPAIGLAPYHASSLKDRVLSADEVARLWQWLQSDTLPLAHSSVLKLQVLTGARCGEIRGIVSDEIDTGLWIWTLPAARSKNGKPEVTPLVGLAREIVRDALGKREARELFSIRVAAMR